MKKKILLFVLSILGLGAFAFSFLSGNKNRQVFADSVPNKVTFYGKNYDLPLTVYLGYYDQETDKAYAKTTVNYYGSYDGSFGNHTYSSTFTITDQTSITKMIEGYSTNQTFTLSSETYGLHGNDGLSYNFLILSYNTSLFTKETLLSDNTVSGLLEDYDDIEGIVVPNAYKVKATKITLFCSGDEESPTIAGLNTLLLTDYDDPITVEEIQSKLTAIDNVDGDISDKISIKEDNYSSVDPLILGDYTVTFEVSDEAENTSELTITIRVEDIVAPTISGPETIQATTNTHIDTTTIMSLFTVSDNYDSDEDIEDGFELYSDSYTLNSGKIGTYDVVYKCVDSSGNTTFKNVAVSVIDDTKPLIYGNNSYVKSCSSTLKLSNIMNSLTANDNCDGDLSKNITVKSDNYSKNSDKAGEYKIVFTVTDSSGNTSNDFTVTIKITDDIFPVFYVDSSFININQYNSMTRDEIVAFLISTDAIDGNNMQNVSFIVDNYSGHESEVGEHNVSLKVTYKDGKESYLGITMNVIGDGIENIVDNKKEESLSLFQKIAVLLANIATKIAATITNLVSKFVNFFKF